jgi:hypothetical protein
VTGTETGMGRGTGIEIGRGTAKGGRGENGGGGQMAQVVTVRRRNGMVLREVFHFLSDRLARPGEPFFYFYVCEPLLYFYFLSDRG